jgi:hypothetical protein
MRLAGSAALVEVMTLGDLGHGAGGLAGRQNQQRPEGGAAGAGAENWRDARLQPRAEQVFQQACAMTRHGFNRRRCGAGCEQAMFAVPLASALPLSRSTVQMQGTAWLSLRPPCDGARHPRWKVAGPSLSYCASPKIFRALAARKGACAMPLDEKTHTELEAAAFRRLLEHLRARTDVQNIDLMNLAGFCRNCLSNWMKEPPTPAAWRCPRTRAVETIYGMPYEEWKAKHQKEAPRTSSRVREEPAPALNFIACVLRG